MKSINWLDQFISFLGVIAGVLLAFYITEIDDRRSEKRELRSIRSALIEDLSSDHRTFSNGTIPQNTVHADKLGRLIESIRMEIPDSIGTYFEYIYSLDNFSPTSTTYNSVVSSGKLDLIPDLNLRNDLTSYYDILSEEAAIRGQIQADYLLDQIIPWMVRNVRSDRDPVEQVIGQFELINHLEIYRSLIVNKIDIYESIKLQSEALNQKLEDMEV